MNAPRLAEPFPTPMAFPVSGIARVTIHVRPESSRSAAGAFGSCKVFGHVTSAAMLCKRAASHGCSRPKAGWRHSPSLNGCPGGQSTARARRDPRALLVRALQFVQGGGDQAGARRADLARCADCGALHRAVAATWRPAPRCLICAVLAPTAT